MRVGEKFQSRSWLLHGQALAWFLCVAVGVFQVLMFQPLCVCWSDVSRESESESRGETEEVDCFAQVTSGPRNRSRQTVPQRVRHLVARARSRVALFATFARPCVVEANPAWHSPLRC